MSQNNELPPLPKPEIHDDGGWHIEYFTASQMCNFARAALAAQAVRDE